MILKLLKALKVLVLTNLELQFIQHFKGNKQIIVKYYKNNVYTNY